MKNQYFGDIKDLFKFDFIGFAIQRIPALDRFTYISIVIDKDVVSERNVWSRETR
jgi:hypothetical protein